MTCTSLGPESLKITVKAPAGSFFRNLDRHSGAIAGDDGIFVSDFTRFIELLTNGVVSEVISNFDSDPLSTSVACADLTNECFLVEDGTTGCGIDNLD